MCRRPGMVQPPTLQGWVSPAMTLLLQQLWEVLQPQRAFMVVLYLAAAQLCHRDGTPWSWGSPLLAAQPRALGSSASLQPHTAPETNLPANLLLAEIKSNTESGSGDPRPSPFSKPLLSQPAWSAVVLPPPWHRAMGSSCPIPGQQPSLLTPFRAGRDEAVAPEEGSTLPPFPRERTGPAERLQDPLNVPPLFSGSG